MKLFKGWLSLFALLVVPVSLHADMLDTIYFRGNMSPANEVPPVTNESATATGKATIAVHARRADDGTLLSAVVDFDIDYNFPVPVTVRGLHIHEGAANANGPVRIDTGLSGNNTIEAEGIGNLFRQALATSETALAAIEGLLANPAGYYVNLHTSVNAGGLLRDQLTRMERTVVRSALSPANENPPIAGLDASAAGSAEILYTRDVNGDVNEGTVRYDVNYSFPGAVTFTGLHIHPGAAGVNGPARLNTPLSGANPVVDEDGVGSLSYKVEVTTAANLDALRIVLANPANAYMNLHTTANPGGAVRGQLQSTTATAFQLAMSPANEVPPIVGLEASAVAKVSLFSTRDEAGTITSGTVVFDVNYAFPAGTTFRGFHIHDGAAGVNGPVRINSGLGAANAITDADGVGNLFYRINVGGSDANGLATLRSAVVTPQNHYLNLHTSANPGGAVRAQLGAMASQPTISANGVVNGTFAAGVNQAAPGSIVTIFGTNLAPGAAGGVVSNGSLTTSLAGTSVRFAGVPAPLLYVSPNQINAQVPFTLNVANASVVVATPGGTATGTDPTRRLTVSAAAPAIFAAVRNSNFSQITAASPVKAGDAIAVFANGLGAGNPAVATGQLPPASPLSTTVAMPTATIGGIPAVVAASLLAPGLVGVNQVNLIVPAGTPSGMQAVQLSVGGVLSNIVMINVQ